MLPSSPIIHLAIADDHVILRQGLTELLHRLGQFKVIIEASSGTELLQKLTRSRQKPDVCIMDVSMPRMNGYEAMEIIREKWPNLKVLVMSMYDHEASIIRMLRKGACGYLVKTGDIREMEQALLSIYRTGFYHSELVNGKLHFMIHNSNKGLHPSELSEKEIQFLGYCCSDMHYAEIAQKMNQSTRTVEGYRDQLFSKLNIRSRAGLVCFALKSGLIVQ